TGKQEFGCYRKPPAASEGRKGTRRTYAEPGCWEHNRHRTGDGAVGEIRRTVCASCLKLLTLENESDFHHHAVLDDLAVGHDDLLVLDPSAGDIAQRVGGARDAFLHRVFKADAALGDNFYD